MTRILPSLLLGLAFAACASAAPPAPPAPAPLAPGTTTGPITAADLRHRLEIVAHDSMEGREVGTRGMERATRYLTAELERLGLRPAGDAGSWLHRVDLVRTRFSLAGTHSGPAGETPLTVADMVPINGMSGLPETSRTRVRGDLVFAGWQVDPSVTAAEELPPAAMEDAVVVVRLGAPADAVVREGVRPRVDLQRLFAPGSPAAAVVLVAEGELEEFWDYAETLVRAGAFARATESEPAPAADAPVVLLAAPAAVERMIGAPLAAAPPEGGRGTVRLEVARRREPVAGTNVVAVFPGRDPARSGEYVAVGAHHDHDGIGRPVAGDSIYNGADDDGSGTVTLLELAEHLAALREAERPARSVLFVWHTAEEKGLLGSDAFTERPTVPREAIVAQLHLDMIGRNHPDTLLVIGSRRLSTGLGDLVEAVNARQPRPFVLDYSWDAPGHPERFYCRSDHYNYARFGIPVTFFTTGLHDDYHQPSDTPEKIDYEKLARVAGLVRDVTLEVANRPGRPVVDRPVPPPGAPCR